MDQGIYNCEGSRVLEVELLRLKGAVGKGKAVARVSDRTVAEGELMFAVGQGGFPSTQIRKTKSTTPMLVRGYSRAIYGGYVKRCDIHNFLPQD